MSTNQNPTGPTPQPRRASVPHMRSQALIMLACLLLIGQAGCFEDTITNQIESPGGSIFGRVMPAEPGTEVAAWQGAEIQSVAIDSEGFFSLSDLADGLYNVVISTPSGLHREVANVRVDHEQSVSLGVIELVALPRPLLGYSPNDGASNVNTGALLSLTSEVPLAIPSLYEAVDITPAVSGTWEQSYNGPSNTYYFRPMTSLQTGTEYQVHINEALQLLSGDNWESTLEFSFTTEPLALRGANWERREEFPPMFVGTLVTLEFNSDVDGASIAGAIRTEPPVPIFATSPSYSRRYVMISVDGHFVPGTHYDLLIDETLEDSNGHPMASPESLPFAVEAFRVTYFEIRGENGHVIDSGGELFVEIALNARVDPSAFNNAAAFDPNISGVWLERTGGPATTFEFFPTDALDLRADQSYTLTVSGNVPLADGLALGSDFVSQFRVQPIGVREVEPRNGERGVYLRPYISVTFNAAMNETATEAAFTFKLLDGAAVPGTIVWYSDGRTLSFQPDADLQPQSAYVISISTAAQTVRGEPLGSALSSMFRTR